MPSISGVFLDIKFVPQSRYCGARARDIGDPFAVNYFNHVPGFAPYTGPIVDCINEDCAAPDWGIFFQWLLSDDVPDSVRHDIIATLVPPESIASDSIPESNTDERPSDIPDPPSDSVSSSEPNHKRGRPKKSS